MTGNAPGTGGVRRWERVGSDLRLELNNTIDAVDAGRRPMVDFLVEQGVSAKTINRVEVIFEELVSNTIRHGFVPGSAQIIHVRAHIAAKAVELTFEDDGIAFNPLEQAAPAPFTSIGDATLGGLGIPLVLRLTESAAYTPLLEGAPDAAGPFRNRFVVRVSTQT